MNSTGSRLRSERGAELIEFALIVPILLLTVLGIADFGFMFQRYEVLTNATREGARLAVLPGYGTVAAAGNPDVKARVCAYLDAGGVPTSNCSNPVVEVTNTKVTMSVGPPLEAKQVRVSYKHSYLFIGGLLGLLNGSFTNVPMTITTVAVMRTEFVTP